MKPDPTTYFTPFLSMTRFWLTVLAHIENLSPKTKARTTLDVYTPILPWEYLLQVPMLYRYYQSGSPEPEKKRKEHFPGIASQECETLYHYYQSATTGLYKIRYVVQLDMTASLCQSIDQLCHYQIIDAQEKQALFHQLRIALDRFEARCTESANFTQPEINYTTTFNPVCVKYVPGEFASTDPTGAMVLAGTHSGNNYKHPYLAVLQNSQRINQSNPHIRLKYFAHQRQVFSEYQIE